MLEREDILEGLESAFDELANEYINESNRYDRLREIQDKFMKYHRLMVEESESFKELEEFCSSYM